MIVTVTNYKRPRCYSIDRENRLVEKAFLFWEVLLVLIYETVA